MRRAVRVGLKAVAWFVIVLSAPTNGAGHAIGGPAPQSTGVCVELQVTVSGPVS